MIIQIQFSTINPTLNLTILELLILLSLVILIINSYRSHSKIIKLNKELDDFKSKASFKDLNESIKKLSEIINNKLSSQEDLNKHTELLHKFVVGEDSKLIKSLLNLSEDLNRNEKIFNKIDKNFEQISLQLGDPNSSIRIQIADLTSKITQLNDEGQNKKSSN